MDVREKLVELIEKASYECDEGTRDLWDMRQVADGIADFLIANGVTVQECVQKCWDVCNNNGNIQYRCPNCETVYVYMYKNHIAPDVCKECGTRLYLPQPPKGETIYCKDCEHLMFSDCYGECANGHKGIVNPNDTCEHAKRKPPKGE